MNYFEETGKLLKNATWKVLSIFIVVLCFSACKKDKPQPIVNSLRAPAYPLITIDPYTNGWLFGDTLYNHQLSHHSGRKFPLLGVVRVDGEAFRFMGIENEIKTSIIAPTADQGRWQARYTLTDPGEDWEKENYDDSNWHTGEGAFGHYKTIPFIRTPWETDHIWVRREVILNEDLKEKNVYLEYTNDDDALIYINGIEVVNTGYVLKSKEKLKLPEEVVASLKKGRNVIAARCMNRMRNSIIDFGLSSRSSASPVLKQTAIQKSVNLLPTQTIYTFVCGAIDLKITFTAPLLMNDLDLMSRPVNYISYEVSSNDSQKHQVEIYLEASTIWALNYEFEESQSEGMEKDKMVFVRTGSARQDILNTDERSSSFIDWGHFYLSAAQKHTNRGIGDCREMRNSFCREGFVSDSKEKASNGQNYIALSRSLGKVKGPKEGYFMVGYDDLYSIQYFGENLRPYWNRKGDKNIFQMFKQAKKEYKNIIKKCEGFNAEMMQNASKSGGKEYAELCALAYRQTLGAHKLLVSPDGELLFFSRSMNLLSTVDVTYPSSPIFLLYNVELLKGLLNPIFHYAKSGKWEYDYAPHDIGRYPHANGQISDYMLPVEESGNMLILMAAIASHEGNASYAEKHWDVLSQWADYLLSKGLDVENQMNTDVFTGYSAHNTNLSIKSILGIASYARLADMLGKNEIAKKYSSEARSRAFKWTELADEGDHYRFAFDQADTWSQKYNLVWDKIMKIDVFPHEVREKEVAYYLKQQNEFGLPLDSRSLYTKADWIVWTATLAPNQDTFRQFISPLYRFVNETQNRVPMSDWIWTDRPENVSFQGRPVVGGYFIKMLDSK